MSRLVRFPKSKADPDVPLAGYDGDIFDAPQQTAAQSDNYLERVAKYIPAEVLAFFIFINAILDQAVRSGGPSATMVGFPAMMIATAALIIAILLVPVFVWYMHDEGDAWITNACVSFLAFPFWAYAIGAVAFAGYRDGNLAAILLATFTVVSGVISPPVPRARSRKKQAAATPKEGPRLVNSLPELSA